LLPSVLTPALKNGHGSGKPMKDVIKTPETPGAKLPSSHERSEEEVPLGTRAFHGMEQEYLELLENMNEAVYSVDVDGKITYVSPVMETITKSPRSEILGRDFKEFFSSRERPQIEQAFESVLQGETAGGEYRMFTKSGDPIKVFISCRPVFEGEEIVGVQGILNDVTERFKTRQALAAKVSELAVLNNLGKEIVKNISVESTVKTAMKHVILSVKPDHCMLFLREGDSLILKDFVPKEGPILEETMADHRVGKYLCDLAVKEGRTIYFDNIHTDPRCIFPECKKAGFHSLAALPLVSRDGIIGVLGVASRTERGFSSEIVFLEALSQEIAGRLNNAILYEKAKADAMELETRLTQLRKAEQEKRELMKQLQQTQKVEAIGTLAGGIAHDFNNILGGIIGYTELALAEAQQATNKKIKKYLETALVASDRARNLVRQILQFSRRDDAEMGVLSIKPILKESLKFMRSILPAFIEIQEHIEADADTILGDPTQIHQTVINLCTNAYHAMGDSGGTLSVSLKNVKLHEERVFMSLKALPGDYVRLRISDTGCGIPAASQDRIFDPYFTTKATEEGTGLGLAVTQGIVKAHKGLIEMVSEVGEGSRFDIYLPVTEDEMPQAVTFSPVLRSGNHERILVVDDEQFCLDIIKEHLGRLGYFVTSSLSSPDALKMFRDDPTGFDLLVTDQAMPGLTGTQLVSEVRSLNTEMPVIMCTGYSETVSEQTVRQYGITKLLMKPITRADLIEAVQNVLK
jgi:PAS domain S-box-containing protein